MSESELDPPPLERSITGITIWEFLSEYIPQETLMDIREITVFDEAETDKPISRAFKLKIADREGESSIYSLDVDDTILQYSPAKIKFHQQIIDEYLPNLDESREIIYQFIKQINKASRIVPKEGVHPEMYIPTLEVIALTQFISAIKQGTYGDDGKELIKTHQSFEGNPTDFNEWVRNHLILPILSGESTILPSELPLSKFENNKTYFHEQKQTSELLATAIDLKEANLIADKLSFASVEDKDSFISIYSSFQQTMFKPEVNEMVIPKDDDGGKFILATFGEDRFQLIKVKLLLEYLKTNGLRLPDEILFFDLGRKAPVITRLLSDDESTNLIHLDNSYGQCQAVTDENNSQARAVHFNPKDDINTPFAQLISN